MTVQEARQFIAQAETLPVEQIDLDRLAEAIQVLQEDAGGATGSSERTPGTSLVDADAAGWLRRAEAVVERVMARHSSIQDQRAIGPQSPEDVAPPVATGFMTGMLAGGATPAEVEAATGQALPDVGGAGGEGLTPQLEQELRDAAEAAGVDPIVVEAFVSDIRRAQAQGMPVGTLIAGQIDQWRQIAESKSPAPIGVPRDFTARRQTELHPADRARFGGAAEVTIEEIPPRYFEGDHMIPATYGPERIIEIQKQLERAGLLMPGSYWAGFWDDASQAAYYQVLAYSNQRGTEWEQTIEDLIRTVPEDVRKAQAKALAENVFQEPAYIKPDWASLTQEVKALFRSRVGREPTDEELAEWAGFLSESYRAQHEAMVEVERAEFERERASTPVDIADDGRPIYEHVDPVTGMTVKSHEPPESGPIEGVAVDPIARFFEAFEARYRPEIQRLEALPQVRQNMANVTAALASMGRLVGG